MLFAVFCMKFTFKMYPWTYNYEICTPTEKKAKKKSRKNFEKWKFDKFVEKILTNLYLWLISYKIKAYARKLKFANFIHRIIKSIYLPVTTDYYKVFETSDFKNVLS